MSRVASRRPLVLLFVVAALCLILLILASISVGARDLPIWAVIRGLVAPSGSESDHIIWRVRIPRIVLGVIVGAALALAGALMQAITRNPLADPGLLGVNAGAAAAIVIAIIAGTSDNETTRVIMALIGAGAAAAVVVAIGGGDVGGGRLVLAGAAVSASLAGVVAGVSLIDQEAFDHYRFWAVGSLADQDLDALTPSAAPLLVGAVLTVMIVRRLDLLALGDDSSASLGVHPGRTRLMGLLAVVLLCGAATATVGPIAFLGLAVPHAARLIAGPRSGWVIAFSLMLGPILLLGADLVGRMIARPGELEVAIVMGIVGAPVFIALVRTRRVSAL